jgi:hypothetical protein
MTAASIRQITICCEFLGFWSLKYVALRRLHFFIMEPRTVTKDRWGRILPPMPLKYFQAPAVTTNMQAKPELEIRVTRFLMVLPNGVTRRFECDIPNGPPDLKKK